MKTAVLGEDAEGHIVYNRALVDFARHHGFHPKACRPYRAKTTDEVEQPFSALRMLFCNRPQATARRRAGCEVRAWPRSPQGRSSFAAPVGARFPRRVHASVCRL
jgi:transposase